jgi:branched-chain amino acid transport system substrate-binding protein
MKSAFVDRKSAFEKTHAREAHMKRRISLAIAALLASQLAAAAADQIKIGMPMILSGPGALFGEPTLKGAQMYVDEINAQGGVLGKKLQLISKDSKGNADEAVRVAREMVLKDEVDFIVGTFTAAEGPAVSPISKENKIVFIAPVSKPEALMSPANIHPYIFRTSTTTTIEGRSAAALIAKMDVKRVATMSPDYAYGQEVTAAFVAHLKKIKPEVEIVDQQWPKLGEADYTPFINAQLSKKPEAVFSSLWGGHFVTFIKQAKPLGYFDAIKLNFIAGGEAGSIESAKAIGDDYPLGIWGNAYDIFYWAEGPTQHKEFIERLKKYTGQEHPSSWPAIGYVAMQVLVEGIKKANSTKSDDVAKALVGLSVDTPIGKQTIDPKTQSANRGQFWGKMVKDARYPFAVMEKPVYVDPTAFVN